VQFTAYNRKSYRIDVGPGRDARKITGIILKKRLSRKEHPDRLAPQDPCILGHEGRLVSFRLKGCSMASWIAYRLDNTNANARLRWLKR
jgi:hypothetical protein